MKINDTSNLYTNCSNCQATYFVRKIILPISLCSDFGFSQQKYLCKDCYIKLKDEYHKRMSNTGILLPNMDKITSTIFLGNSDAGKDYKRLLANEITHILVIGNFLFTHYPNKFKYKVIEIEDDEDEDISIYFKEVFDFIDSVGNGKILVHCFAGASRSASFVIAYLMQKDKKIYPKVYSLVKNRRNLIQINNGFKSILMKFDFFLKKTNYKFDQFSDNFSNNFLAEQEKEL